MRVGVRTQRSADIVAGSILTLFGVAVIVASRGIPEGAGGYLHPRTFPLLLGVALAFSGAWVSMRAMAEKETSKSKIEWPDKAGWRSWLLALAFMVSYVAVCRPAGFLLSTFAFILIFVKVFGQYSWKVGIACALGTSLFVWGMFVKLLDLTLPLGPFEVLLQ